MPRFRFSIAGLMAVMIPLSIGFAALRSANQVWVNIVFNLVVAVLLVATYKAKCAQGIEGGVVVGLRGVRLGPPRFGSRWNAVGAALRRRTGTRDNRDHMASGSPAGTGYVSGRPAKGDRDGPRRPLPRVPVIFLARRDRFWLFRRPTHWLGVGYRQPAANSPFA